MKTITNKLNEITGKVWECIVTVFGKKKGTYYKSSTGDRIDSKEVSKYICVLERQKKLAEARKNIN